MNITFEIVNVPNSDYHKSENYPHYGWFLFVEEGYSGWMGAALVTAEGVKYGLLSQKREVIVAEILSQAAKGDGPPPLSPKIALRDAETKTFSFEDILRALAAAAGTLPPDLK